jgi:hypothetical protein
VEIGDWVARLVPGLLGALFFIIGFDWLQTRNLNARRRPAAADDRVTDEVPAPATRVYLAAIESCEELGWQIHAADDAHYTLWAINRTPHLGLRNIAFILQLTPFGSGETRVVVALNSPHPAWVRRRFRATAGRFVARLRLRALNEPPGQPVRRVRS